MRTKLIRGRWLLCGAIIPSKSIKHGQLWAAADGIDRTVTVSTVRDDWVGYTYDGINGVNKYHEKSAFDFQCRYCLVLPTADIPKELL